MLLVMQDEMPNIALINQFVATAEEAGISKAARRLRISQPALSKNIRKLEHMLGTSLFERHAGGATLTEAGRVLLDRAQVIRLEYQVALQDIRNVLSDQDATIRIGAGPIWSSTFLPIVVEKFHRLYPRHRLQVRTAAAVELLDALRLGKVDIMAGPLLDEGTLPGFIRTPLVRSEMVILASEDHPLARERTLQDPARLADYPFVAYMESRSVADRLTRYLKRHGAKPPRYMLETSSLFTCLELVRSGSYLFFDTRMLRNSPIGRGVAEVRLPETIHAFDTGLIYREGAERLPPMRRLIRIMADTLSETAARILDQDRAANEEPQMRPHNQME